MAIFHFPVKPRQLSLTQIPGKVRPSKFVIRHVGGKIRAGFPSPATEYMEDDLCINRYLIANHNATFIFTVIGDSMTGAGIMDEDKVVVDRSVNPRHVHIVVASINGEYTIKRLYKKGGAIALMPENPTFNPICFQEFDSLEIWGVVTGMVRKLDV